MTQDSTEERRRKHMAVMDDGKENWQSEAMHQNALLHDALTRAKVAEAKLAKAEVAEAKLAKAVDALKEILFLSNEDDVGGWFDALARAQDLMAELENVK